MTECADFILEIWDRDNRNGIQATKLPHGQHKQGDDNDDAQDPVVRVWTNDFVLELVLKSRFNVLFLRARLARVGVGERDGGVDPVVLARLWRRVRAHQRDGL